MTDWLSEWINAWLYLIYPCTPHTYYKGGIFASNIPMTQPRACCARITVLLFTPCCLLKSWPTSRRLFIYSAHYLIERAKRSELVSECTTWASLSCIGQLTSTEDWLTHHRSAPVVLPLLRNSPCCPEKAYRVRFVLPLNLLVLLEEREMRNGALQTLSCTNYFQ